MGKKSGIYSCQHCFPAEIGKKSHQKAKSKKEKNSQNNKIIHRIHSFTKLPNIKKKHLTCLDGKSPDSPPEGGRRAYSRGMGQAATRHGTRLWAGRPSPRQTPGAPRRGTPLPRPLSMGGVRRGLARRCQRHGGCSLERVANKKGQ